MTRPVDTAAETPQPLARTLVAEYLGSLLLAALVIGSGIAAQRLSPSDTGLQLVENAAATAAGLFAIILMFAPISGAHFNPVVSCVDAALGGLAWWRALAYVPVQIAGCVSGAVVANLMFSAPAISISTKDRATTAHGLAEVVATIGLVLVIFTLTRSGRGERAPAAVGAYIGAAYWFTSSTSFANPAITIGRMFSDTFAGIAPSSVPLFLAAQLVGGGLAVLLVRGLYPTGAGPGTTSTVQRARSESGTTRRPLPHRGCPLVGRTPAPRAIRSGHFASARSRRLCSARDTRTGLDESGAVTALRMAVFGPGGRDHICTV